VIPVAYYTFTVVNSFATRAVDHIGPFSAHIDEPSEFAAARKLALRGDIDGAVSMYRNYRDNQVNALFEAARLLRSEDRFYEAATLFEEIAQRFEDQGRVWAEAMYQLARLKEAHLGERQESMALLKKIIQRAPEGRFAQLAGADIARLHILERAQATDKAPDKAAPGPARPKKTAAEPAASGGSVADAEEDLEVPVRDPFFVPRTEDEDEAAETASETEAPPAAPVKAPAKKKAAAKKKTAPAKKRPAK
jgi:tetratricopeptide (TPR) repeat protein